MVHFAHLVARRLLGLVAAAVFIPVGAMAQAPAVPSIEDFFRNPAFADAHLSPDGKRLGVVVGAPGKRQQLAVLELGAWDKVKIVATFANADVYKFRWVNDRRLVFDIVDMAAGGGEQYVTGIYGVDVDGGSLRYLSGLPNAETGTSIASRVLDWRTRFFSTLDDGSDDIIVSQRLDEEYTNLLRLNTRTGVAATITQNGPKGAFYWVLDRHGQARYVMSEWNGTTALSARDKATSQWTEVTHWETFSPAPFAPELLGYDDELYVSADSKGFQALYRFDPATKRAAKEPLIRIDGFDLDSEFEIDAGARRILGVHFKSDAPASYWFDATMKAAQAKIDAQLPGTVNRISCGRCLSNPYLLVHAQSDREPGVYYVYEVATGKLERIFRTRPWLDARSMGRRDFARVPSRDGKQIPTWITLPPTYEKGRAYPMVVLVHGGPWVRGGDWLWSAEAQFFATRGYVVIEPEFRGSTGFGDAWFRASFKQWGLAMQDDVADAARWAVARGYANGKRICIAGASYGGYAVLMGLARDGDLYRCGVQWVGVTDLDLEYTSAQSDASDQYRQYGMPVLIGDRKKDAEQLHNTSPVYVADRINRPLLMAYGGEDRRVPVEHGRKFYNAVVKTNPQVEWVLYPDEGHGWALEKNRFDFYKRVEKFLARNLKDGAD